MIKIAFSADFASSKFSRHGSSCLHRDTASQSRVASDQKAHMNAALIREKSNNLRGVNERNNIPEKAKNAKSTNEFKNLYNTIIATRNNLNTIFG